MSAPADPYLLLLLVTHPAHYLSQGANISTGYRVNHIDLNARDEMGKTVFFKKSILMR